jgi:hypothetical protein
MMVDDSRLWPKIFDSWRSGRFYVRVDPTIMLLVDTYLQEQQNESP